MPTSSFVRGAERAWVVMATGVRRQVLGHLDDLMVVRVDFDAGAIGAMHHHPHRQVTYVVSGRFEVTVGSEVAEVGAGDTFVAAGNVPHGVRALEPGTLIDTFTPARADFLAPVP